MRAKRLFVSLEFPDPIAKLLVRLNPDVPGIRWLGADQIHLTLAFLGGVGIEEEKKLQGNLRAIQFGSFFLPLQGIGSFPGTGRPKIIWIGVGRGHPHLFQLHKRVADAALAAGIAVDFRPWHPHVTLARCAKVCSGSIRRFLRSGAEFDAGLVPIDSFQLKSSVLTPSGSTYATELLVSSAR